MTRKEVLTGKRYGKLTIIGEKGENIGTGHRAWLCRCDCGNERMIEAYKFLRGRIKSCGCYHKEWCRKPVGVAGLNSVIRSYKAGAAVRNIEWNLSDDDVKRITSENCFFCGKQPSNKIKARIEKDGVYIYSGIDRIDNTKGYEIGNVVSCCWECNVDKRNFTVANIKKCLEFIGYEVVKINA